LSHSDAHEGDPMTTDLLRQWTSDEQLVTDDCGHVGRVIGYKDAPGAAEAQVRLLSANPDHVGTASGTLRTTSGPPGVVWLPLMFLRALGMKPAEQDGAARA
jgi:hypothetical protein